MDIQKSKSRKADLMLVFVTLCWGLTYIFLDICLKELTPFMLTAYRFLGSFLLLLVIFPKKILHTSKETILNALLCSVSLTVTYLTITYGVMFTTISNAAFLCSTTSIFVALLLVVVLKKKLKTRTVIAIAVGMIGMALLTLKDDFSVNLANFKGDLLCTSCGFFYAVNLLSVERSLKNENVDSFGLSAYQLGFVGAFNLIGAALTGSLAVPSCLKNWGCVAFLVVFSTCLAFVLQIKAQKNTKASHVAVIFCLEPVFAALAAYFITGDVMSPKSIIGAVILFISVIILEL